MVTIKYKVITSGDDQLTDEIGTLLAEAKLAKNRCIGRDKVALELARQERYIIAYSTNEYHTNEIFGLVSWRMEGYYDHGIYELTHIATATSARGLGVGRMLFTLMEKDAYSFYHDKGYALRKLFLRTGVDNSTMHRVDANGFYEKLGMQLEYVAPRHFRDYRDENV